jgi:hypothetical protein
VRRSVLVAAVAFVVGAGSAVAWFATRPDAPERPGAPADEPHIEPDSAPGLPDFGFREAAEAAGLTFRMTFLEGEQGTKFKVNLYDHGAGVAVADVDGDGDDDVYFCNQLGANALFRNDGRGRFTDVTKAAGGLGLDDRICVAATFADADGDGDQDLSVTSTRGGNAFFRNKGDGTFTDDTKAAGLELVAHSEQGFFFDADGDCDLDLLVTNTAKWTTETFDEKARYWSGVASLPEMMGCPIEQNVFYRNTGRGVFVVATEGSGLEGRGWGGDCAIFDVDEDGDLDVFAANMFGRSALLANDGKGSFRDVTKDVLGKTSWGTVGAKVFDADGDGQLDLFTVDMHSDMWMDTNLPPYIAKERTKFASPYGPRGIETFGAESAFVTRRTELGLDGVDLLYGNSLFRARGVGRYEETSDRAGLETLWPWGIAAGDFDADGWTDVYIPSGMGYPYRFQRSPLLMGGPDGHFVERTGDAGISVPPDGTMGTLPGTNTRAARSVRAAAVFDADGDGRLDLVVNAFNDRARLYMNRSSPRHWVGLRLVGTACDRDATGALVRIRAGGRTFVRQVAPAGGYLSQSTRMVHVGLGDANSIDECEIRWPNGRRELVPIPTVDRVHRIVQSAE